MKHRLNYGWTKEKVMQQFKAKNNGTISANDYGTCLYRDGNNNHCAVGAFIPDDENKALAYIGDVIDLTKRFPHLNEYMPFDIDGLFAMQQIHDNCNKSENAKYFTNGDTYKAMQIFLDKEVEDNV
jgi:hypothetical protein